MIKIPKGIFPEEGKEPVISRIFKLVDRYPSRSDAARVWDMNINTLQNYYKRKDICPIPRRAQLLKIAEQEKVSLEWLLTGIGNDLERTNKDETEEQKEQLSDNEKQWLEMYRLLNEDEQERLLYQVKREGILSLFKAQNASQSASQEEILIGLGFKRTTIKTMQMLESLSSNEQREILRGHEDKKQASLSERNSIKDKKNA